MVRFMAPQKDFQILKKLFRALLNLKNQIHYSTHEGLSTYITEIITSVLFTTDNVMDYVACSSVGVEVGLTAEVNITGIDPYYQTFFVQLGKFTSKNKQFLEGKFEWKRHWLTVLSAANHP